MTVKNLSNPTFITAGGSTSCAVDSGKAYCWGALGGGDSPSSNSSPVEQALPSGVIEIAMGANHACALLPEERIYCWGGEALGVATQHAILKKPVLIRSVEESEAFKEALPPDKELKDLKNATSIAVGASASCALLEEGTIRCWGADGAGQLGQRTLASLKYSNVPIAINELKQVTEITMGREHSCAVASGVPYCWGSNRYGALGNNSSTDYSPNPVTPLNLAATEKISAGSDYTCAISNGTLKCWGNNDFGQLGNNSKTESKIPVPVEGMTDKVTTVALGTDHTCAIVDGLAKCWGRNDAGQLGNNSKTASNAPIAVETLTANVTAITVGSRHSCAIVNGGARCWGNNSSGQLGNNSTKDSLVPVPVQDLSSDVTAITAGSIHSCAIHKGRVKCWGGVDQGTGSVLGVNDRWALNTLIPQELIHLPSGASKMSAAEAHSCALVDHKVYCWGQDLFGRVGNRREVFEATASGSVVMVPVLVPILD